MKQNIKSKCECLCTFSVFFKIFRTSLVIELLEKVCLQAIRLKKQPKMYKNGTFRLSDLIIIMVRNYHNWIARCQGVRPTSVQKYSMDCVKRNSIGSMWFDRNSLFTTSKASMDLQRCKRLAGALQNSLLWSRYCKVDIVKSDSKVAKKSDKAHAMRSAVQYVLLLLRNGSTSLY